MPPSTSTKLFAGPSLTPSAKEQAEILDIDIQPPIQRGDLPRLLDSGFCGTIVIADGLFYRKIPVGHIEIREAINAGCTVYGLSSMGAIRAYEMRNLGMIGFGKVYEYFFKLDDFQDDEMALLHAPVPPYLALSEPLVHFRYCLDILLNEKLISSTQKAAILKILKNMYFGKRTLKQFLNLLSQQGFTQTKIVEDNFENYRIKQQDLFLFLMQFPDISDIRS